MFNENGRLLFMRIVSPSKGNMLFNYYISIISRQWAEEKESALTQDIAHY